MKSMKKILAVLLAVMLMVPSMAVFAATPSATAKTIKSVTASSKTYNGKKQTTTVKVTLANGKTLSSKYYTVSGTKSATKAGTYTVKVTAKAPFKGTKTAKWTIAKKHNIAKAKTVSTKRNKTITVTQNKVCGKAYNAYVTKKSAKKYFKLRCSGSNVKITIKKNAPKGTYKIGVSYKGDSNHKFVKKYITIKVK